MASHDSLSDGDEIPDLDEILDHRYRRYMLYCLMLFASPIKLLDISRQIAIWDNREHVSLACHRIYDELCEEHLPLLVDNDIVLFEPRNRMVRLHPERNNIDSAILEYFQREVPELLDAEKQVIEEKPGRDW